MRVGVVGAGAMGSGIARVAAAGGNAVLLHDTRAGAAAAAIDRTAASLQRQVEKGRLSADEANATLGRIGAVDALAGLADCDLVIEAVVEDLAVKQGLFAELEGLVAADCILATNTSSLAVGAVFRHAERPERTVGLHFFNPPHVMKLVEVIPGPRTAGETVARAQEFARGAGKTPVVAQDSPGFIVNFAGRAYNVEGLAIVQEGVATARQVDRIMHEAFGFPMGPFALMDLTGVDVNYPVTENIFEHNFGEPMLRSTWQHRYLLEAGLLGQKSGRGFYTYPRDEDVAATPPDPGECAVVLAGDQAVEERRQFCERAGLTVVPDDGAAPVLLAPLGEDCTTAALRQGIDPRRVVGVDLAFGERSLVTLMAPPGADRAAVEAIHGRVAASTAVELINDSPGFVAQRVLAAVVNLGAEMAQRGTASPRDIDMAVELGLRYPRGPLAWAEHFGPRLFATILEGIHRTTHDPRYRVNRWLRRRAAADLPIHHPDLVPVRAPL